jgi:DNA adenine methylase/adenine-specific DNA-methyltransferase
MGSKYKLLSWIHETLTDLPFESALDAFSGSGAVGYLFKAMGKQVIANDFLNFCTTLAKATIENPGVVLPDERIAQLLEYDPKHKRFIERKFKNIFYTPTDLRFLDRAYWNISKLKCPHEMAIAKAALIRSCVKRQPRGVFTVAGDLQNYNDGRRDLCLSLKEHFVEQIRIFNGVVFSNNQNNFAAKGDIFEVEANVDLVYMDPPYVPHKDDNCYVKRYHFLEGLSCYWENLDIMEDTKVKKIKKKYTPFSYRKTAIEAFDKMFRKFCNSILVLSYSSNGYPDLEGLTRLMGRYKTNVTIHSRAHRYHFGTHENVQRAEADEYLIVGT